MKTHTIKTPTAKLMIVELSRKADVEIFPNSIEIYNQFTGQEETIKGSYTILGKPDEISEEDAKPLVYEVEGYNPVLKEFHPAYRLYNGRIIRATHTAKESLLSLLETEIYWENPYPYPSPYDPRSKTGRFEHGEELEKAEKYYNEAEQKTFDRSRSIILVKN